MIRGAESILRADQLHVVAADMTTPALLTVTSSLGGGQARPPVTSFLPVRC